MKTYEALLVTCLPHKRGEDDRSYEAGSVPMKFSASSEDSARTHFTIEADARQRSLRAHGERTALVRYVWQGEQAADPK